MKRFETKTGSLFVHGKSAEEREALEYGDRVKQDEMKIRGLCLLHHSFDPGHVIFRKNDVAEYEIPDYFVNVSSNSSEFYTKSELKKALAENPEIFFKFLKLCLNGPSDLIPFIFTQEFEEWEVSPDNEEN